MSKYPGKNKLNLKLPPGSIEPYDQVTSSDPSNEYVFSDGQYICLFALSSFPVV